MSALASLVLGLTILAASPADALKEAAERYAHGDAAGAADAYEAAVRAGADNADVYFNLGTSALRAGDVGRAVWALLEARTRSPWDEDVRFNLALARKENGDTLVGSEDPAWLEAMMLVPRAPVGWAAVALFILTCGLLTLRGVRGPSTVLARWTGRVTVATVLLGALAVAVELTAGAPTAVVVAKEAVAHSTERKDAPEAFRVHAGLPVRLVAEPRNDLVRVRLSNGLEGFVEAAAIRRVGGPRG